MTIVNTLTGISVTTADVAVPQLAQANLTEKSRFSNPQTGSETIVWVDSTTDPQYPLTVTVRLNKAPKGGPTAERKASVTIETWARTVVDGIETAFKPFSATIAVILPGQPLDSADIMAAIGNLYGLLFPSLASKIPDLATVNKLIFGLADLY